MPATCTGKISLPETGLFDQIFLDYLKGAPALSSFYEFTPGIKGIEAWLKKNNSYPVNRKLLRDELQDQNKHLRLSATSKNNIELVLQENVFTVTTGHQLCLFTGPLYFVYKILSTINYCELLNEQFPDKKFVPVYWMASEDHDLEEISEVQVFGKNIKWSINNRGAAGKIATSGIEACLDELTTILGNSPFTADWLHLLRKAYLEHTHMAEATRFLVNELFGKYGLIILDPDSHQLKEAFIPFLKKDLFHQAAESLMQNTMSKLEDLGYKLQVKPRNINLFYLQQGFRERIYLEGELYKVMNSTISFTSNEMTQEVEQYPERFSPNVVLRPLYQQLILPNVAYVGGPGEIAYWLEYCSLFKEMGVTYPVLLPRNFALCVDKSTASRLAKLNIPTEKIFTPTDELIKQSLAQSGDLLKLTEEKEQLEQLFAQLAAKIEKVDKSLVAATDAEKQKSLKALETLEQKALKALKTKNETEINQIKSIKEKLFPGQHAQERKENISALISTNSSIIEEVKTLFLENKWELQHYLLILQNKDT